MSDLTSNDQSITGADVFSPPATGVVNFALGASPTEFMLTYGRSRVVFNVKASTPESSPAVEWLQTLSMSPVIAKQLLALLQLGIETYEKAHGTIVDPSK